MRSKQIVLDDRSLCALKWPGMMVDVSPKEPALARLRVETVSLREPVLERAGLALVRLARRPIGRFELGATWPRATERPVHHLIGKPAQSNARTEIGKVKEAPRRPDGERIRGVEAEKPDPWAAFEVDVEPQIEFWKCREVRKIRQRPAHDTLHSERDDSNPGRAVEGLDFERWGDQGSQRRRWNGPVGKQQVAPRLPPRPSAIRDRPGAMVKPRERRVLRHSSLPHHQPAAPEVPHHRYFFGIGGGV